MHSQDHRGHASTPASNEHPCMPGLCQACTCRAHAAAACMASCSCPCMHLHVASLPGAHILSGNVLEPKALDELLPDWKTDATAPIKVRHEGMACSQIGVFLVVCHAACTYLPSWGNIAAACCTLAEQSCTFGHTDA